jgi:hypothetical protein
VRFERGLHRLQRALDAGRPLGVDRDDRDPVEMAGDLDGKMGWFIKRYSTPARPCWQGVGPGRILGRRPGPPLDAADLGVLGSKFETHIYTCIGTPGACY